MVCFRSLGDLFVCLRFSGKLQVRVVLEVESVSPVVICLGWGGEGGAGRLGGEMGSQIFTFLGPEAGSAPKIMLH